MGSTFNSQVWNTYLNRGLPLADGNLLQIEYAIQTQPSPNIVATNDYVNLKAFGTYATYYANAYDEFLFEAKYGYENNGVTGTRMYFVKSANSDAGGFELRDADGNVSISQANAVSTAPLLFPRVCGEATPPYIDNVQVTLVFAMYQDVNNASLWIIPSLQARISTVGYTNYPQLNSLAFYCNPGNFNGDFDAAMIGFLGGEYWSEGSVAPTGHADGGGGSWNRPDYDVPIPSLPAISPADTGFMSTYQLSDVNIKALANELWQTGGTSFYDTIVKNYQSPFDNIISVGIVPFTNVSGADTNVKIGNYISGVLGKKLTTTFYEVDCGTIAVPKYYNTFVDYDCRFRLFLPYIGMVEVDPDTIINPQSGANGSIQIKYHIDLFSGACTAYILTYSGRKYHVTASYQGNIKTEIPITGTNYIGAWSGLIGACIAGVGGSLGGVVTNLMNAKPEYQRSGSISSTAGLMGIQYPYLIISTPDCIVAETFEELKGFVSNLSVTIEEETGFLQSDMINSDMTGLSCTEEEQEMIRQKISDGVYIGTWPTP